MKLVMLSGNKYIFFFGGEGGAPMARYHVDLYFFELYYTHMYLENTLGKFAVCSNFSPPAVSGAAPHIVS